MQSEIRALINRLNLTCRKALESAAGLCVSKSHYNVELEHFLIKLIEYDKSDVHAILRHYEIDPQVLLKELHVALDKLPKGNTATPSLSTHIFRLLEEAWVVSSIALNQTHVRSAAIFLALVDNDSLRGLILETCPLLLRLSRQTCRQELTDLLPRLPENLDDNVTSSDGVPQLLPPQQTVNVLDSFTQNLTLQAREGKLDPVYGRDQEIRQIIDILSRRKQNNPILVGEAGVGKTAIVEGLAQRIVLGQVPPHLRDVQILALDFVQLQAGASVKGQFEERLNTLLTTIRNSSKPVILFVDEAHALIGAGGTAGLGDAANLLKPALARGEVKVIAATTWSEYKRYFEKDSALARRFEVIKIEEPTVVQAVDMLRSLSKSLAEHHNIQILDEAIHAAVTLSKRYIMGRQLPDKAIRILDTAAARVALLQSTEPEVLQQLAGRQQLLKLEQEILSSGPNISEVQDIRLKDITHELTSISESLQHRQKLWGDQQMVVQQIRDLRTQWLTMKENEVTSQDRSTLLEQFTQLEKVLQIKHEVPVAVDKKSIAAVIADWTGVPSSTILANQNMMTYETLMAGLQEKICGQSIALEKISQQIINYQAGLTDPHKPIGVFLLVGPTGVGKTETAQVLAEVLTGQSQNLLRFNMTEFQESHSVATLKGAPPGYVGYGRGGTLTEAVRQNPYSVVLLDEIDKAHRDVLDLFYQIFDKGMIEDAEGIEVDFSNTLILMTSNLGADVIVEHAVQDSSVGQLELLDKLMPDLIHHFRSALLARMVVIPYMPLQVSDMTRIARQKLEVIRERIHTQHNRDLIISDDTSTFFIQRFQKDLRQGARAIDHWISSEILPGLARLLSENPQQSSSQDRILLQLNDSGKWVPILLTALNAKSKPVSGTG